MSEHVVNCILLSGYLVSESELRELPDGKLVCWFRLASSTSSGQVGYFDVIVLGGLPAPGYLGKGQGVLVQGSLESARWEEGEGPEREAVCVLAEHLDFVGMLAASKRTVPSAA
jgi:single-stranded DNA-binding protein